MMSDSHKETIKRIDNNKAALVNILNYTKGELDLVIGYINDESTPSWFRGDIQMFLRETLEQIERVVRFLDGQAGLQPPFDRTDEKRLDAKRIYEIRNMGRFKETALDKLTD